MYVDPNFKTKKALQEALELDECDITVYAPGLGTVPENGTVSLEGPHFPAAHSWYAQGTMQDGRLVAVK